MVLRWAMFNGGPGLKGFKNAESYFYTWDEGYWRLIHDFDTVSRAPKHPHPRLGWMERLNPGSLFHQDGPRVGRRRPVLLYGDSFSACIDSVQCFEDILNTDSAFSLQHYLLNHGMGGYGVCQASLLCRATAPHYQKPLVVFGMLTTDVERTILPFRVGQKPYYDVEGGELQLKGYPIDSSTQNYLDTHPLGTTSYLFRRYIKSKLNIVPYRIKTWYDGKEKSIDHIREVNSLLIHHLAAELRAQDIEFIFLVFHFEDDMMSPKSEENWYDQFLRKTLADNQIPYIWSKEIIRNHRLAHPENSHDDYIIPGDGHPTTLYNNLIAAEIKKEVFKRALPEIPALDSANMNLYEARAWANYRDLSLDSAKLNDLKVKAAASNISLEEQVWKDAYYLMNDQLNGSAPFQPDGVFDGKWRFQK
ncbi:MAG: hypothetical protein U0176_25130 [Bacteroidia bacterium]